jgi:hypothetical protein
MGRLEEWDESGAAVVDRGVLDLEMGCCSSSLSFFFALDKGRHCVRSERTDEGYIKKTCNESMPHKLFVRQQWRYRSSDVSNLACLISVELC